MRRRFSFFTVVDRIHDTGDAGDHRKQERTAQPVLLQTRSHEQSNDSGKDHDQDRCDGSQFFHKISLRCADSNHRNQKSPSAEDLSSPAEGDDRSRYHLCSLPPKGTEASLQPITPAGGFPTAPGWAVQVAARECISPGAFLSRTSRQVSEKTDTGYFSPSQPLAYPLW